MRPEQHPSRQDLSNPESSVPTETTAQSAEAEHVAHLWERSRQASPGLLYVCDARDGSVLWVNGGVSAVLGWSPEEVAAFGGQLHQTFIHPDDLKEMVKSARELALLPEGAMREKQYRMRHRDGSWRWLHSRDMIFARDENGNATQLMGAAVDITERRIAEGALVDSEQRLSDVVKAAQLGIWNWDLTRDKLTCNIWKCRMFGLDSSHEFSTWEEWTSHVHPGDRALLQASIDEAIQKRGGFECEFRALWADGTIRWIAGAGNVSALDEHGNPRTLSGISLDISARRSAERELQNAHDELEQRVEERSEQLSTVVDRLRHEVEQRRVAQSSRGHLLQRLVDAQEAERRRLSRELHDQFGQTLTALLLAIDSIGKGGALPEADQIRRNRAREITQEVMEQSHKMAWDLRPASLDNLGLVFTLQQSTKEWSQNNGIAVDFVSHGLKSSTRLPPKLEIAFFRVVQEALANVVRHANASQVSVILEGNAQNARVIIEDNGCGFAPESLNSARLGLLGMRERLEAVGGKLEIESSPGSGTAVFASAPLHLQKVGEASD